MVPRLRKSTLGFGLRLLFFLILAAPPAEAGVFSACARGIASVAQSVGQWLVPSPEPAFDDDERGAITAWANRFHENGGSLLASFTDEQSCLMLAELPKPALHALLREARASKGKLPADALSAALFRMGLAPWEHAPLSYLERQFRFADPDAARERILAAVGEAARLPADRKQALWDDYRLRREVLEAKKLLSNPDNPEYRLAFRSNEVIFPDGKHYRYTPLWTGGIRIWVRYGDILRTQTYESSLVVSQYVDSPALGLTGFHDLVGPDGRVLLFDQHHRTKAYALRHWDRKGSMDDVLLPFNLYPRADGHYYSTPHWSVFASANFVVVPAGGRRWANDPTWSFLAPSERDRIIQAARRSPIAIAREIYYRETRLAPTAEPASRP